MGGRAAGATGEGEVGRQLERWCQGALNGWLQGRGRPPCDLGLLGRVGGKEGSCGREGRRGRSQEAAGALVPGSPKVSSLNIPRFVSAFDIPRWVSALEIPRWVSALPGAAVERGGLVGAVQLALLEARGMSSSQPWSPERGGRGSRLASALAGVIPGPGRQPGLLEGAGRGWGGAARWVEVVLPRNVLETLGMPCGGRVPGS